MRKTAFGGLLLPLCSRLRQLDRGHVGPPTGGVFQFVLTRSQQSPQRMSQFDLESLWAMSRRFKNGHLLWLLLCLGTIALGVRGLTLAADFSAPGTWEHKGVRIGSAPLPDDGELQGYCGSMFQQCSGMCALGSFQDRGKLHVRFYANLGAILVSAPELTRGQAKIGVGMSRAEIVGVLGRPAREFSHSHQVLAYDYGTEILAVTLQDNRALSVEVVRKFTCPVRGPECAYYGGWWWDHLRTKSDDMATYDSAWPWHRGPVRRASQR